MKVDYVHKDTTTDENIRKEFSDVIYPTMVIRSQAEILQEKEIERLNNIINKFEEELKWQRKVCLSLNEGFAVSRIDTLTDKLQELKGSDKE